MPRGSNLLHEPGNKKTDHFLVVKFTHSRHVFGRSVAEERTAKGNPRMIFIWETLGKAPVPTALRVLTGL